MVRFRLLTLLILLPLWEPTNALAAPDLLPPEQAFKFSVGDTGQQKVQLIWDIADGYYLYQKKFTFETATPGIKLGKPYLPAGIVKNDEYFGEVVTYRSKIGIDIPVQRESPEIGRLDLKVTSQGCADIGVCYPPHKQTVSLDLPPAKSIEKLNFEPSRPPRATLSGLGLGLDLLNTGQDELLPPDEAFKFNAEVKDSDTLHVQWQIADGYYLYREKFKFSIESPSNAQLAAYSIPRGKPKHDEAFGNVEVFYNQIAFDLPLSRIDPNLAAIELQANYQGCADLGVCYPPIKKLVALDLPASLTKIRPDINTPVQPQPTTLLSEQDQIAEKLKTGTFGFTVLSFFGFGLLLAFTPCIFPMIPILSGLLAGQGDQLTTQRAFLLSLSYVFASAAMYTLFGVLAGLFGSNLQATFQEPWIIIAFSAVFVALALSMFGLYELQIPSALQSRLTSFSNRQRGGSYAGAAMMGGLSALIVGPCVAAPLAGALIYIGQTGDALLGGVALFALGLGMGVPLLAIGASAGTLLPKAGAWMNTIKAIFGVGLIAVAIWLLERILPAPISLLLWAGLLIVSAVFMGAVDSLPTQSSGWRKLGKGSGIIMLTYGILLVIGAAAGGHDPLQPLSSLQIAGPDAATNRIRFTPVKSLADVQNRIRQASQSGQWVMLDFYADWCISCKEMERFTFSKPEVQAALSGMLLIQADVTKNSETDMELLRYFGLIGPPAILFFGPDQQERNAFRLVGYKNSEQFLGHIEQVKL